MRRAGRLPKTFGVVGAAAVAMTILIVPASAHSAPVTLSCLGHLSVDPGLTLEYDQDFEWTLSAARCSYTSGEGRGQAKLVASGLGFGRCGRSVAAGGTGFVEFEDGHVTYLADIGWDSAGSVMSVFGVHDGGGLGSLTGDAWSLYDMPCLDATDVTRFDLVVSVELT